MKVNMNIMKKSMTGAFLALAAVSTGNIEPMEACTRAVYIGPEQMVITGRTMDWKEDIMSNIYVFPRGMKRAGYNKGETVNWTSKYGSVIATGYDIGTCDGINEKGLVASLLFLPESVYSLPGDTRPVMGISIWTQYVLDNFATVHEAVEELKKETFRIDAPRMPNNGPESTLHLAITDETGNTAILEYLDGKLNIHEGKEYRVMTNSPRYEEQLAINRYWEEIGGLVMLPGNKPGERPFCTGFFLHKSNPPNVRCQNRSTQCIECHAQCIGSLRYKYTRQPHISSTRWWSSPIQKNKVYYFESTLTPNLFWLDLKKIDFSPSAKVKKLPLSNGEIYAGDAIKDLRDSKPFDFLFQTPVM